MAKNAKKTAKKKADKAAKGKTAKKAAAKAAPKKAAGKRRGKADNQLTYLAMGLLAVSLLWFLIASVYAGAGVMQRRGTCQDWLHDKRKLEQGWARVYDTTSERQGCNLTKIAFKGFIAKPPIYPKPVEFGLALGPPAGLMALYLMMLYFKRNWILRQKKKIWAQAGPLDFDDFEDMREEEYKRMDPNYDPEAEAKKEAEAQAAAEAEAAAKAEAEAQAQAAAGADGEGGEIKQEDAPDEVVHSEAPDASDLEAIFRNVDKTKSGG